MDKKLKLVTISGADNRTNIDDMKELSEKYPFLEWAILASPKRHGQPRYPTISWISDIESEVHMRKSLHLCGGYSRLFAINRDEIPNASIDDLFALVDSFDRVQLNLSNQLPSIDLWYAANNIFESLVTEYILQLPGNDGESLEVLAALNNELHKLNPSYNVYPFLDASGGRGVEGRNWNLDTNVNNLKGFAGGINKDNVKTILDEINKSIGDGENFWIDMESGVRSNDILDLTLVEDVLKTCVPYAMA